MIPENYDHRRHAYIKHVLLRQYLKILFPIIGRHQDVIWYVDCFAGPWQVEEDDTNLEGTSISISINIMRECQEFLRKTFNKRVVFKALYVEKDPDSYLRLQEYLSKIKYQDLHLYSLNGEFYNLRGEILKTIGDTEFAFFFIDPKGWKQSIEIPTLKPLLKRNNAEFLINFMYLFINRNYSAKIFNEQLKEVFGSEPTECHLCPEEREKYLINQYRDYLKSMELSENNELRTAYVSILDPQKDRTKYHLVYVTRHPLGIIKFFEVSENIDLVQSLVREQTKQERLEEKTGQMPLFAPSVNVVEKDKPYSLSDIKEFLLSLLEIEEILFGINEMAEILEKKGWFISEVEKAFLQLEEDGKVRNLDAKGKRKKHPIHYEDNNHRGERIVRLK